MKYKQNKKRNTRFTWKVHECLWKLEISKSSFHMSILTYFHNISNKYICGGKQDDR